MAREKTSSSSSTTESDTTSSSSNHNPKHDSSSKKKKKSSENRRNEAILEPKTPPPAPSKTPDASSERDNINPDNEDGVPAKKGFVFCPPGINIRAFIPPLSLLLGEGIMGPSIGSYASYMVVDVGAASTIDDAGDYSGLIASSFFICQFISSLFLGLLSDRYGRRPILLFSCFASCVFSICFGLSTKLWMAILFRALAGLSNGSVGIAKTSIGEMSNRHNRVKAFTFVGLMFGIGTIVGSAVGGFTARPAVEYSEVFSPSGFWGKYPYALPNFIVAAYFFVAFVFCCVYMIETNPAIVNKGKPAPVDMSSFPTIDIDVVDMDSDTTTYHSNVPIIPEFYLTNVASATPAPMDPEEKAAEEKMPLGEKIRHYKFAILAVIAYSISSIIGFVYVTIVGVWTVATVPVGGLGFTTLKLGLFTAAEGFCVIVITLFIAAKIVEKLTLVWTIRLASICLIPVSCCAPLANNITKATDEWVVWLYLILIAFLWQVGAQLMFNSSLVMITNSVHPSKLGTLNGISQALGSLARAISPVTISPLLAWSFGASRKFPTNYFFSFFLNAVLCIILLIVGLFIPHEINIPYIARMEMEAEKNSGAAPDAKDIKGDEESNEGISDSIGEDEDEEEESSEEEKKKKKMEKRKKKKKGKAKERAVEIIEDNN